MNYFLTFAGVIVWNGEEFQNLKRFTDAAAAAAGLEPPSGNIGQQIWWKGENLTRHLQWGSSAMKGSRVDSSKYPRRTAPANLPVPEPASVLAADSALAAAAAATAARASRAARPRPQPPAGKPAESSGVRSAATVLAADPALAAAVAATAARAARAARPRPQPPAGKPAESLAVRSAAAGEAAIVEPAMAGHADEAGSQPGPPEAPEGDSPAADEDELLPELTATVLEAAAPSAAEPMSVDPRATRLGRSRQHPSALEPAARASSSVTLAAADAVEVLSVEQPETAQLSPAGGATIMEPSADVPRGARSAPSRPAAGAADFPEPGTAKPSESAAAEISENADEEQAAGAPSEFQELGTSRDPSAEPGRADPTSANPVSCARSPSARPGRAAAASAPSRWASVLPGHRKAISAEAATAAAADKMPLQPLPAESTVLGRRLASGRMAPGPQQFLLFNTHSFDVEVQPGGEPLQRTNPTKHVCPCFCCLPNDLAVHRHPVWFHSWVERYPQAYLSRADPNFDRGAWQTFCLLTVWQYTEKDTLTPGGPTAKPRTFCHPGAIANCIYFLMLLWPDLGEKEFIGRSHNIKQLSQLKVFEVQFMDNCGLKRVIAYCRDDCLERQGVSEAR